MTLSKSALTVTSLAMAMLFGGGVYILMNMNILAKNYIEREASRTLGVGVRIGQLEIALPERTAVVKNLTIANPEGFEKPYAVKVETISVALGDLSRQLINFRDIDVGRAEVNLEVRENVTNITAIKNRVKAAPPKDPAAEPVKVIIDRLTVSQAQIRPAAVLFTPEDLPPVPVPDIVLAGVGKKENGVLADEAIAQVWTHIAKKIESQSLKSGLLEGMSDKALGDMGQGFTGRVQEKVDGLGRTLNRMFSE